MDWGKDTINLALAMTAFAVTHFVMSGFLRRSLLVALGRQFFLLLYSLVSLCLFSWGVVAFDRAPATVALWDGTHPVAWIAGSILSIAALALFLPSFMRNPALAGKKSAGVSNIIPSGVFTITRHPMMWGISLWAFSHIVVAPELRVFLFMGTLVVVALLGSYLQDKRKVSLNSREFTPWMRRTSFLPDPTKLGRIPVAWTIALIVWFLATTIHWHFFGIPAGLWKWIG